MSSAAFNSFSNLPRQMQRYPYLLDSPHITPTFRNYLDLIITSMFVITMSAANKVGTVQNFQRHQIYVLPCPKGTLLTRRDFNFPTSIQFLQTLPTENRSYKFTRYAHCNEIAYSLGTSDGTFDPLQGILFILSSIKRRTFWEECEPGRSRIINTPANVFGSLIYTFCGEMKNIGVEDVLV